MRNTTTEEEPAVDETSGDTSEDLPETVNHKHEVFSMTDVEVYLVGQGEHVDRQAILNTFHIFHFPPQKN